MVYPAMVAILQEISREGIGKNRKNAQQGYSFRGVDDVMNAFAPLLAKHGLAIVPSFSDREVTERATKAGGAIFVVTVKGTFRLIAADGSSIEVGPIYGEASDTADKATNKAMATAFKYALFQAFCVPLEGVTGGDADEQTHEIASKARAVASVPQRATEDEFRALKGLREETQVSVEDLTAYVLEVHKVKPGQMTSAMVRDAMSWLALGAPAERVPAA